MTTQQLTGAEAGLSRETQIRIALQAIKESGGTAPMSQLYKAVEQHMNGAKLSNQGRASLRKYINKEATSAGLVFAHDPNQPGWRITSTGREFLAAEAIPEEVVNVDTEQRQIVPSNSVRGTAFETYVLSLLKKIYPDYAWY